LGATQTEVHATKYKNAKKIGQIGQLEIATDGKQMGWVPAFAETTLFKKSDNSDKTDNSDIPAVGERGRQGWLL